MKGDNGRSSLEFNCDSATGPAAGGNSGSSDLAALQALTTYTLAYAFSVQLDVDLATGRRHYRNKAGRLLHTPDEVIRAIIAGELGER